MNKEHEPNCNLIRSMRCAVIHLDGLCPYDICNCEATIKASNKKIENVEPMKVLINDFAFISEKDTLIEILKALNELIDAHNAKE